MEIYDEKTPRKLPKYSLFSTDAIQFRDAAIVLRYSRGTSRIGAAPSRNAANNAK